VTQTGTDSKELKCLSRYFEIRKQLETLVVTKECYFLPKHLKIGLQLNNPVLKTYHYDQSHYEQKKDYPNTDKIGCGRAYK